MAMDQGGRESYDPRDYSLVFGLGSSEELVRLVDSRLESPGHRDDLDSLLRMATADVLRWLRWKAGLADGEIRHQPYVSAESVSKMLRALEAEHGDWSLSSGRRKLSAWKVLHAGLLRDLACASYPALGQRLQVSSMHAHRLADRHRYLVAEDEKYGRIIGCYLSWLRTDFPP
jgi:hypothetical protein